MRPYYRAITIEPLPVTNSAVTLTATTDIALFAQVSQIAIPAGDVAPGKAWKLTAGGVCTTAASGTWVITPRFGQLVTSPSMGASGAVTTTVSGTAIPWVLEFWFQCRTLALTGVNSTFTGHGRFQAQAALTVGASWTIMMGGTIATADVQGVAPGIQFSVNASITACTITPQLVLLESLN
jgi:hypothetical protein